MGRYLVLLCSIILIVGCDFTSSTAHSEEVIKARENFEITGDEKDEIIGDINERIFETIDRRDKSEENQLHIKTKADRAYQVPVTGRYEIYGFGTGFIYLHDENDEIIHKDFFAYGMESVTVDVKEEYFIRFSGLDQLFIKEVDTEVANTLTPGIWEVGNDIEPGDYMMTGEGYGYLSIMEPTEESQLFEVIGSPFASSTSNVQLKEGQKVILRSALEVNFDPIH